MILIQHKNKVITRLFVFLFVLIVFGEASGQTITIKGLISDESGKSIAFANAELIDFSLGTCSNNEGFFVLETVKKSNYRIKISAVSYETEIFEIDNQDFTDTLKFELKRAIVNLKEIEISADSKNRIDKPGNIQFIEKSDLNRLKSDNLFKTLNSVAGVNSINTGSEASKPVIRGMSNYRVSFAKYGIKQEYQKWDNHQGICFNQETVDHLEIIKGPASVKFGSDAMGGAINILPNDLQQEGEIQGHISLITKSNTGLIGESGELKIRKHDLISSIVISNSKYGDIKTPNANSFLLPSPTNTSESSHSIEIDNTIPNTAGNEKSLSAKTGIVKDWGNSFVEFEYNSLTQAFFDWQGVQYDSLKLIHAKDKYDINLPYQDVKDYSVFWVNNFYNKENILNITAAFQKNTSKEFAYLEDRTGNRIEDIQKYKDLGNLELDLELNTTSINSFYRIKSVENHNIEIGSNLQFQKHRTDGYSHILPNYTKQSSGIYVTDLFNVSEIFSISTGLRFDNDNIFLEESINPDPEYGDSVFNEKYERSFNNLCFSTGLSYRITEGSVLKVNIGNSYRTPSAYELGSYGLHRHEIRFEKGNLSNNAEKSWNFDISFENRNKKSYFLLSPYLNYFSNYLYLNPTSELRSEGQMFEYTQNKAVMLGGEAVFSYKAGTYLSIKSTAEYVYAVNLDLKSALAFIPPFSLKSEITCNFKNIKKLKNSYASVEIVNTASQRLTIQNELTTPGYNLLNLNFGSVIHFKKIEMSVLLKIQNVFNTEYFDHLSFYRRLRINEKGRDIQLFLSIPINYQLFKTRKNEQSFY